MRTLIYQVKVGNPPTFYNVCIDSVQKYCTKYNIDHIVQTEPILKIRPLKSQRSKQAVERLGYLPIFEKENAFNHLNDYDAVAIIDADIYINDNAPDLFDQLDEETAFAGVREADMPLTTAYQNKIRKFSNGQYGKWYPFYNMGMMLLSNKILPYLKGQTPEQFIRRKEFEKYVNGEGHHRWSTDQTLLNQWLIDTKMKTKDLNWKWNTLVKAVKDDALPQAYFLHFFLAAKFPKKGAEIPGIIKDLNKAKKLKGHG